MMEYLVSTVVSFIFILKISCNTIGYSGWYQLSSYKFYPQLGDCYEIYSQEENVTSLTCQKSADIERQSCIDFIHSGDEHCLGLKTPTNEIVEFICKETKEELLSYISYDDLSNCFKVHNVDRTFKTICQQNFDKYSIGIITPDNFTIMFSSFSCSTSMTIDERKTFNNFVNNYTFDLGLKSCYKVFNQNQIVSPYTCLNKDVYESCIHDLPENNNCMGLITQNNETIVLDCAKGDEESSIMRNCFKIHTLDNKVHVACQQKVEERCVGITTPSNLTVLLDCYYCSEPHIKDTRYDFDQEKRRKYRHFVKSYINKEYNGENSYLKRTAFYVLDQKDFVNPFNCFRTDSKVYAYWLPNTNCYGLTLESNETIILNCIPKEREAKPGCYQVVSPEKMKTTVCITVLDEVCVGITTPGNLSVILACYHLDNCVEGAHLEFYQDPFRKKIRKFVESTLHNYTRGYYAIKDTYQVMTEKGNYDEEETVHLLRGHNNCRGVTLKNFETIILECPNKMPAKHGCFDVYGPKYDEMNNGPEQKVQTICIKILDERCVGIITPNNWTILLDCIFKKETSYPASAIWVPNNGMPSRM